MKKLSNFVFGTIALVMVCCVCAKRTDAQNPYVYGTANMNESFLDVLVLGTSYYALGVVSTQNQMTYSASVMKVGTNLTTINWVKELCGPSDHSLILSDIEESLSGNLIVVGNVFPGINGGSNNRYFVAEINANTGDVLQSKIIDRGGNFRQVLPHITKVRDGACGGGYIVSSWVTSSGSTADNVFAMKLDYGLNVQWAYDYNAGGDDEPSGIIPTPGGGAIIAGHTSVNGWMNFLLEIDAAGGIVQQQAYKPTAGNAFLNYGISRAFNGDILLCGAKELPLSRHATACRINGTSWAPVWSKVWDTPPNSNTPVIVLNRITQLPKSNGHVFAVGYTDDLVNGGTEPRIIKFNFTNGAANYYRDLGGSGLSLGSAIGLTATTSRVVLASAKNNPAAIGLNDGFLTSQPATLNTCGAKTNVTLSNMPLTLQPIDFARSGVQLISYGHCCHNKLSWTLKDVCQVSNKPFGSETSDRAVMQNDVTNLDFDIYPNPTHDRAEIIFHDIEKMKGKTMTIADLNGRVLKTQIIADASETVLDLSELPTGVYILKAGDLPAQKLSKL